MTAASKCSLVQLERPVECSLLEILGSDFAENRQGQGLIRAEQFLLTRQHSIVEFQGPIKVFLLLINTGPAVQRVQEGGWIRTEQLTEPVEVLCRPVFDCEMGNIGRDSDTLHHF